MHIIFPDQSVSKQKVAVIYTYIDNVIVPDNLDKVLVRDSCRYLVVPDGGRRSPEVACWTSDHWVASSNPLRGKFRH